MAQFKRVNIIKTLQALKETTGQEWNYNELDLIRQTAIEKIIKRLPNTSKTEAVKLITLRIQALLSIMIED